MDIIPVSIKITWSRSSLIYNARTRHERSEYNRREMNTAQGQHEKTSEARARHEQHKCKMSAVWVDTCGTRTIQVRNECYTNDAGAARLKNFDLGNDTSKIIFAHPYIYYMLSERLQREERSNFKTNNFIIWKCLAPMPKCIRKVLHKNWHL